jgi:hypothetical protein
MPPHFHIDFVVPPTGCGRSVTDLWDWGAHKARLRCPDDVSDDMCERGVPGGPLNLSSTSYPDQGRCGNLPLKRKIPTAEPRIEPGTSCLVVRSSDHQATRLIINCSLLVDVYYNVHVTVVGAQTVFAIAVSPPFCPCISLRYKKDVSTICFRT